MLVALSVAAAGGCAAHPADTGSGLSLADQKTVQLLRAETDALLRDIVIGNLDRLRTYFPPDCEVNVSKQLELHLHGPPRWLKISRWDAEKIVVRLAPGGRRAETVVTAQVSEEEGRPIGRLLQFTWAAADAGGEKFYLVPLDPSSSHLR